AGDAGSGEPSAVARDCTGNPRQVSRRGLRTGACLYVAAGFSRSAALVGSGTLRRRPDRRCNPRLEASHGTLARPVHREIAAQGRTRAEGRGGIEAQGEPASYPPLRGRQNLAAAPARTAGADGESIPGSRSSTQL